MLQMELFEPTPDPLARTEQEGIALIMKMIEQGDQPAAAICRQIAMQIALLYRQFVASQGRKNSSSKAYMDRLRCYRELERSVVKTESLVNGDRLDLDGPKFKYVFGELISLFRTSMKAAGIDFELSRSALMHLGDLVRDNEARIRSEVRQFGANES